MRLSARAGPGTVRCGSQHECRPRLWALRQATSLGCLSNFSAGRLRRPELPQQAETRPPSQGRSGAVQGLTLVRLRPGAGGTAQRQHHLAWYVGEIKVFVLRLGLNLFLVFENSGTPVALWSSVHQSKVPLLSHQGYQWGNGNWFFPLRLMVWETLMSTHGKENGRKFHLFAFLGFDWEIIIAVNISLCMWSFSL